MREIFGRRKGYDVYTAVANTGGFSDKELKNIEERAYKLGSVKHVSLDVTQSITKKYQVYDFWKRAS